jgi:Dolichyl-phosphate-mannose-protein mannosyltransferase
VIETHRLEPLSARSSGQVSRQRSKKPLLLISVTLLSMIYFAGLVSYANTRAIDCDEGFYATAARLVWEGKAPYRDFFFQQAPLVPYLYSSIWGLHPRSLVSMRLLSVAFGGLAVFLWGMCLTHAKQVPGKVRLAAFGMVLLNPSWISWNVVLKTYAVANLLMSIAMISLYIALHSRKAAWYGLTGLALGLCTSARALYGPLIVVLLVWVFYQEHKGTRTYLRATSFLVGAACGLVPLISTFPLSPHAFIFNNVHYHALQGGYLPQPGAAPAMHGFADVILVYFAVLAVLLLAHHLYFTLQVLIGTIGILSILRLRKKQSLPYDGADYCYFEIVFLMLLFYTATALIPFPPFDQHFTSPLVPMLIPFIMEGLRVIFESRRRWVAPLIFATPILALAGIGRDAWEYSRDPEWQLSSYKEVASTIERNSGPDDVVLSLWPGYVFESGRRYFPGLENNWGYGIMRRTTAETRARYHIVSNDDVVRSLANRVPALFVMGESTNQWTSEYYDQLSPAEIQHLETSIDSNYVLVQEIDRVKVYGRRSEREAR